MMNAPVLRPVLPVRRDVHFALSAERIAQWHPQGPEVTLFFGAMSLFFPEGERMFIRAVRHFRDAVCDPEMDRYIAGFIAQEAQHAHHHQAYNDLMRDAGLPTPELEMLLKGWINDAEKKFSPAMMLAMTLALEHWTAVLSEMILNDPSLMEGADPAYVQLWRWHALEEIEHKAVAFDVYRKVIGTDVKAYLLRCAIMLSVTVFFWTDVFLFHHRLLRTWRHLHGKKSFNFKKMLSFLKFAYVKPGPLLKVIPAWAAYFKPGFHPWNANNHACMEALKLLEQELAIALAEVP